MLIARIFLVVVLFVANGISFAATSLPVDVKKFTDQREGCDHFRSEPWDAGDDPETKDRRTFIFKNVRKLCMGTDQRLASLRKKYRSKPTVIKHLRQYEDRIEGR